MTQKEALRWLSQVDGRLYRSPRPSKRNAWVAVVQTPRAGLRKGKLIVALGETMLEATQAAAEQWREVFSGLGEVH